MIPGPRDCLAYFKERLQKQGPLRLLRECDVSAVFEVCAPCQTTKSHAAAVAHPCPWRGWGGDTQKSKAMAQKSRK